MHVLVIEDERKIADFVRNGLRAEGFTVDVCNRGDDALDLLTHQPFDLAVLDIMLPGRDGLSVLKLLRDRRVRVPVLILSARGETSERIEGLDLGADDYLAKPFSIGELAARLRALLRRQSGENLSLYKVRDLTLNLITREVRRGERRVELTPREFSLLEVLMRAPGRIFTRTQICERVWEYHFDPGTNLVDVYIQRLRRKIDDGSEVKLLKTRRGVGYYLQSES